MPTREEMFPSRFLKASDLTGKAVVVRIASAPVETLKGPNGTEERKTVLYFNGGAKKVLPLNKTNWDAGAAIGGENSDDWPGKKIELFPTVTDLRGKTVDCIRIRPPGQTNPVAEKAKPGRRAKQSPGGNSDMGDEIPF